MQTRLGVGLLGVGIVVMACSSGGIADNRPHAGPFPASPDGEKISTPGKDAGAEPGDECPSGLRVFNGDCRVVCTNNKECGKAHRCIEVDDESLCLPYDECTYLGDDTQCVASGGMYQYSPRGGMTTFVPYSSTPGADPKGSTGLHDPYFYGGYGTGSAGPCAGNAQWITVPAQTPVGCTAQHTVSRCRLFYDRCEVVTGTTHEFVQP